MGPETAGAPDATPWCLSDRILRHVPGHLGLGADVVGLQRSSGAAVDGACGPDTLRALARLAQTVGGGEAAALRAAATVSRVGGRPAGCVVVLDPAHGGDDRGATGGGLHEALRGWSSPRAGCEYHEHGRTPLTRP